MTRQIEHTTAAVIAAVDRRQRADDIADTKNIDKQNSDIDK